VIQVNWYKPERNAELIWYKDVSKTNEDTAAGVYRYVTRKVLSFYRGQYNAVLLAEVYSTLEGMCSREYK
jgi:hypothetical protein